MSTGPYRRTDQRDGSASTEDTGLVGDLIAQFADPLAFYRELVQNAIDAGSDSVHVTVAFDPATDGGEARVSVRDSGSGMTREIIESELVVLFRSGKEDRDDAIGKFGVGFVSVLALQPSMVEVHTSTGEGVAWTIQLHPDQTYDLYELAGGSATGTTVTLHVPMQRESFDRFLDDSEDSLSRWCRHAELPIHYLARVEGIEHPLRELRIDRPLSIDALVSVTVEEGPSLAIVGLAKNAEPYAGFFNRGLTLYETSSPVVGKLAFAVRDSTLEHTLSRDNVRHDEAYRKALSLVGRTGASRLLNAIEEALAVAATRPEDGRYTDLLTAVAQSGLALPTERWTIALIEPMEDESAVRASALPSPIVVASKRSQVTVALATAGVPVVDDRENIFPEGLLARLFRDAAVDANEQYAYAELVESSPSDLFVLDRIATFASETDRQPHSPCFVRTSGVGSGQLTMGLDRGDGPWLREVTRGEPDPFRMLRRPRLGINADHPLVVAARRRAPSDPELAAYILTRAVLIERKRWSRESEALTVRAITELLGGAS